MADRNLEGAPSNEQVMDDFWSTLDGNEDGADAEATDDGETLTEDDADETEAQEDDQDPDDADEDEDDSTDDGESLTDDDEDETEDEDEDDQPSGGELPDSHVVKTKVGDKIVERTYGDLKKVLGQEAALNTNMELVAEQRKSLDHEKQTLGYLQFNGDLQLDAQNLNNQAMALHEAKTALAERNGDAFGLDLSNADVRREAKENLEAHEYSYSQAVDAFNKKLNEKPEDPGLNNFNKLVPEYGDADPAGRKAMDDGWASTLIKYGKTDMELRSATATDKLIARDLEAYGKLKSEMTELKKRGGKRPGSAKKGPKNSSGKMTDTSVDSKKGNISKGMKMLKGGNASGAGKVLLGDAFFD